MRRVGVHEKSRGVAGERRLGRARAELWPELYSHFGADACETLPHGPLPNRVAQCRAPELIQADAPGPSRAEPCLPLPECEVTGLREFAAPQLPADCAVGLVINVRVNRMELVTPPMVRLSHVAGTAMFGLKAVLDGRTREVVDLLRDNFLR